MTHIEVACAIIERDGLVLAAMRGPGMDMAGRWEFPGGKIEPGEAPEDALRREVLEELALVVSPTRSLAPRTHAYPSFNITLHPFVCRIDEGRLVLAEHGEARWVDAAEMAALEWVEADVGVVEEYLACFSGKTSTLPHPRIEKRGK